MSFRALLGVLLSAAVVSAVGVRPGFRAFLDTNPVSPTITSHEDDDTTCEEWDWRKYSLKLIKEIPVAGLFDDLRGMRKFEASGITQFDGMYVMVYDSSHTLGVMDEHLQFRDPQNKLVGLEGEESQFEAITVRTRTGTLLAVRETALNDEGVPDVVELRVNGVTYEQETLRSCLFDFNLPGENKGFEGAYYYDGGDRGEFLLGLCEGNHCEGNDEGGKDFGNGRMVVGKLEEEDGEKCVWKTQKVVHIPSSANFLDYSDIAISANGTRVAITTQEDSAVWIGEIDWETFEFVDDGVVLHFPRGAHCGQMYCNVEGVEWIDDLRIMTVTDRAKANQPWQCSSKDQSVQVFALPDNRDLDET